MTGGRHQHSSHTRQGADRGNGRRSLPIVPVGQALPLVDLLAVGDGLLVLVLFPSVLVALLAENGPVRHGVEAGNGEGSRRDLLSLSLGSKLEKKRNRDEVRSGIDLHYDANKAERKGRPTYDHKSKITSSAVSIHHIRVIFVSRDLDSETRRDERQLERRLTKTQRRPSFRR
jgi:hypothetical protein